MTVTRPQSQPMMIDPRGPRFTASVTAVVLAVTLVLPEAAATVLIGVQVAFFATGVVAGVHNTPTGLVFRHLVRPRLAPPGELEDPAPPRFAQAIGLGFAIVALLGYVGGAPVLAQVAVGFALVAALLNAVFGLCLGCELYLYGKRLTAPAAR